MEVQVSLLTTSQPIVHQNVVNTYTKDGMYCVNTGLLVYKYPVDHIFRVMEPAKNFPCE